MLKRLKKSVLLVLCCLICFSMVGCEKKEKRISYDLNDFQISVDGNIVSLPMKVKDFEEMGMIFVDYNNTTEVLGHRSVPGDLYLWDYDIPVHVYNYEEKELPIEECYVDSFAVSIFDLEESKKNIKVLLPGGVDVETLTSEKVDEIYGKPSDIKGQAEYYTYYYKIDSKRVISMSFSGLREGKLVNIIMRYNE